MTYDAKEELLRQKSDLKNQNKDVKEIEQRLINLDKIAKKSKKPRVTTP